MSAGLVIRAATPADLPAVQRVLNETWHATYDAIYGVQRVSQLTASWHSLANLAEQVERADEVFLVALQDGEIVATASARSEGAGVVMLTRLYVLPSVQKRGIGKALLAAVLARFRVARLIRLEVEAQNEPAIGFYESQGFALQRSLRFDGREDTPNTLMMAKRLPRP